MSNHPYPRPTVPPTRPSRLVVESAPQISGRVRPTEPSEWKERLAELDDATRQLIERHPLPCLGAALGLGFLVGKLLAAARR